MITDLSISNFKDIREDFMHHAADVVQEKILLNWQDRIPPYCRSRAMQMLRVAKSYRDARWLDPAGENKRFTYSQTTFLSDPDNPVNDENGKGKIDCSTYMHLVLRGINYANSPYAHKEGDAYPASYKITAPVETSTAYAWADDSLRCSNTLTNTALTAKPGKLVRTAAEFAKYYAAAGRIFPYTDDTKDYVRPGDLIFFRNRGNETDRFSHIHHIGMVTDSAGKYLNVTSDENHNVVVVSDIESSRSDREIAFIARPFYEKKKDGEYPPVMNYLEGGWELPEGDTEAKKSDGTPTYVIATTNLSAGTIWTHTETTHQAEEHSTFTIIPASSPLYLPAGTYRLSGAPCYFDKRQSLDHIRWALRLNLYPNDSPHMTYTGIGYRADDNMSDGIVRVVMSTDNHMVTDENPNPRPRICDRGSGAEFTLESGKWFTADIFIAKRPTGETSAHPQYSNENVNKDIWRPKLIRIG